MANACLVDQDIQPMEYFKSCAGEDFDVTVGVENGEEAIIDGLEGKSVLFTSSRLSVTEAVFEGAPDLELVAKIGTGIDTVDLDAARAHGVTVIHTPGLNALSVAEHAVTLLLAVARNVRLSHERLGAGEWREEVPLGDPIVGRTVGLVGFGNVGRRVAGLLSGFNVDILAYDPYVHEIDTEVSGAELVEYDDLLDRADAVLVVAELTDETRGMVGLEELRRMKNDAVLVNVGRGSIVQQDALVTVLSEGHLHGAGLDVFEEEPLPTSSPLHDFENVIVTPHVAGTAAGTREKIISEIVENARAILRDEPVPERFVATA